MNNPPSGGAWVVDPESGEFIPEHEAGKAREQPAEKKSRKPIDAAFEQREVEK